MKKLLLSLAVLFAVGLTAQAEEVTFNFANIYSNVTNNEALNDKSTSVEPITIAFAKGSGQTNPAYYAGGTAVRAYYANTLTFTSSDNSSITGIDITIDSSNGNGNSISANTGSVSDYTWSGNAETVVLTIGKSNEDKTSGHLRIKEIKVTYGAPAAVSTPIISFTDTTNTVSISCTTENSTIYFTVDNSEPSNNSTQYNGEFTITQTTTVKAIAYVGQDASSVATKECVYYPTYDNFADYIKANPIKGAKVNGPIYAVYQNGQNLYTMDKDGDFMLVYGNVGETLSNGDVLAYIAGNYSPYNGLPEIASPQIGAKTESEKEIVPVVTSLAVLNDAPLNSYIKIKNVTLGVAKGTTGNDARTYTATDSEGYTATIYNTFNTGNDKVEIPEPAEGATQTVEYNIIGFVGTFNGNIQVTPIEFIESAEDDTPEIEVPPTEDPDDPDPEVPDFAEFGEVYVTFDFTDPTSLSGVFDGGPITFNGEEKEYNVTNVSFIAGPISITGEAHEGAQSSNSPRLFLSSGSTVAWSYRFYTGNTVTIAAEEGYLINGIEFTGSNLNTQYMVYEGEGEFSNNTWKSYADEEVTEIVITRPQSGGSAPQISTMTVYYTTSSAINGLVEEEVGNAPVEYYNLQGLRVANPVKGQLYIIRQGKKAVKAIIR